MITKKDRVLELVHKFKNIVIKLPTKESRIRLLNFLTPLNIIEKENVVKGVEKGLLFSHELTCFRLYFMENNKIGINNGDVFCYKSERFDPFVILSEKEFFNMCDTPILTEEQKNELLKTYNLPF